MADRSRKNGGPDALAIQHWSEACVERGLCEHRIKMEARFDCFGTPDAAWPLRERSSICGSVLRAVRL